VGRIVKIGSQVKKFAIGGLAGVGCFVDSCRVCPNCLAGNEQYCDVGMNATYNGYEKDGKTPTYGGYSTAIVVDENYVLHISDRLPLHGVAPLLCAGITTYSPLRHTGVGKGHKVAVLGLGGLGHMAVKISNAFGAEVTMLDFCATNNITSDVEVIDMSYINEAYQRVLKSDVKYRFVIDLASLKS
jgi:uncharacterized zinc-type alcohol dehydrogenase-like protein